MKKGISLYLLSAVTLIAPSVSQAALTNAIEISSPDGINLDSSFTTVESPEYPESSNIGIAQMSSYEQSATLAETLTGSGITSITNATYTGALNASGLFSNGTSSIGIEEGVILTNGDADFAIGPNQYYSGVYTNNGVSGSDSLNSLLSDTSYTAIPIVDPYEYYASNDGVVDFNSPLKPLPEATTHQVSTSDASVLSFDFIPEGNQITLNYVFATEGTEGFSVTDDVNSYVPYNNDALGIFVNNQNYALLPNGDTVTNGNFLNAAESYDWRIDNSQGDASNIEYNFLTSTLSITADVTPGVTNSLSIAIADGFLADLGDFTLSEDSAVFLEGAISSSVSEGSAAGSTQLNALMPDEVDPETGGFSFTFDKPEDMIFIDPEVAVGYVYEVTSEHEFASVLLPLIGDGEFLLQIYNEATGEFEGNYVLDYGVEYFFDDYTTEEVTLFQILGIEVEEEIDPTDVTAFVTGLTFNTLPGATNPSLVTMSQTPITQMIGGNTTPSEVPVPATLALFGLGLVIMARRRKAA
jgi:hypothetical protein